MFIEYFEGECKYTSYRRPKNDFKYGVEINLWDNDHDIEMHLEDFIFPFIAWLVETYGYDPKRYEPVFQDEGDVAFVYFRDDEDRAAFKLIWGEKEAEWDDENSCYTEEGIRVDSILYIG